MCRKCHNPILVQEPAPDLERGQPVYLSRCPLCGYYTDAQMEANKLTPIKDPKDLDPQGILSRNRPVSEDYE